MENPFPRYRTIPKNSIFRNGSAARIATSRRVENIIRIAIKSTVRSAAGN
jgi:hypothetical protein